mmetsp:Transcript_27828/g.46760  ORF Transcript_27828/g.46760 Transcript_27828/m.46760 type:complete len:209 (+) Transcript_27828:605-1231(+)
MSGTSRPRPATEVAIITVLMPVLNSCSVWSRSTWSLPPCRDTQGYPYLSRSWNSWSHFSCLSTNTSTLPFSYHTPSNCSRRRNLSPSSCTSMICVISLFTVLRSPTMISRGSRSTALASFSICFGNVAEKSTVCRSGRTFWMIMRICGSKPMSNMRSASSITTMVTRLRETSLPACMHRMSIIRPGVHTTISEPRFRSAICSATPAPP